MGNPKQMGAVAIVVQSGIIRRHRISTRDVKPLLHAGAAVLLAWGLRAEAQFVDPSLRWRTLDTAHFSVHFAERYRAQARIVAQVAEYVYPHVTGRLNWKPESRTQIVVLDSLDFSNGYASPYPFNFIGIILSPPDEGELLQNREWLEFVLTHEFTHIVHLDQARGPAGVLRRIFGRYLVLPLPFTLFFPSGFPNLLEPNWMIEGLAVYSESDRSKGYGRLGQSHFEGMMRAEVARGLRSLREVHAEGRGFPLNRDYLYGSYFFAFLRERYGDGAVRSFIDSYSVNLVPFRVYTNPVALTGKPMDALWLDYQDWLRARFAPQPQPVQGELLARAFTISSPVLGPDGTRWYVQADGYTKPKLMRQSPGDGARALRDTEQDTRLEATDDGSVLVSQLEICRNHNLFYDLHAVAPDGSRSTINECGRYRLAVPLDGGRIAALSVTSGVAEVAVLERGKPVRSLYRTSPGESISGLAARGSRVVITNLRDGRWSLTDISDGTPTVLVADVAIKQSPRFGDSADEVFFVADYGKVYDVWSWRRGSPTLSRWTRSAFGVKETSAPARGELLLTTIESDGDALWLHRLPAEPLERRSAQVREVASTSTTAAPIEAAHRPYSPLESLRPTARAPLIQNADGAASLGALVVGIDALEVHEYVLAPMIEVMQGELL